MLGNFDFVIIWRFYWFMEKLKNWLLFFLWRTKRTGLKIHKRLRMYSENWRETYLRGCVLIKVGLKVCSENLFQLGLRSWSMYLQEANCTDFLGIFNNSCFVDQFFFQLISKSEFWNFQNKIAAAIFSKLPIKQSALEKSFVATFFECRLFLQFWQKIIFCPETRALLNIFSAKEKS